MSAARSARFRGCLGGASLALVLAGCDASPGGRQICTALFAYITAVAVDANGVPVSGVIVTDTVLRTGAALAISQEPILGAGITVIFSDNFTGAVRESGDSVGVTGVAAGKSFHAIYQFGTDGCHVRRISGPDTVVVR